jgi:hypothetical protein
VSIVVREWACGCRLIEDLEARLVKLQDRLDVLDERTEGMCNWVERSLDRSATRNVWSCDS